MTHMLCRNRVVDFERWKSAFNSHEELHQDAGLRLVKLWRSTDEPNNVFFIFEVANEEKARQFIDNPGAAEAGEASGVVDGDYFFVEDAGGY